MSKQGSLLQILLFFARRSGRLFYASLFVSVVLSFLDILIVATIIPVLTVISGGGGQGAASKVVSFVGRVIDWIPVADPIIAGCLLIMSLTALKFLFGLATEWVAAKVAGRVFSSTRMALLDQYCRQGYSFFTQQRHGDLKHFVLQSPNKVSYVLWMSILGVTESIKLVSILGFLALIDPFLTAMVTLLGGVVFVAIGVVFKGRTHQLGKAFMDEQLNATNLLDEMVGGAKSIIAFGAFSRWKDRIALINRRQVDLQVRQRLVLNLPKGVIEAMTFTLIFGGILVYQLRDPGGVGSNLPGIGAFMVALLKMLPSVYLINRIRLDLINQQAELYSVYDLMHLSSAEKSEEDASHSHSEQGIDEIKFDHVRFGYEPGIEVLKGFDLSFRSGKSVAIVGPSGTGKSTLIYLLLGFYRPNAGKILFDGQEFSQKDFELWRDHIGLVPQNPFMFRGSIRENILFGATTISEEQVLNAARLALVDEFVQDLPNGYETSLADQGVGLSTGQLQRIAIARAIVRDPSVLIFDEATSSLDPSSEKKVQEAIWRASQGKTVIFIAHRLATVKKADRIVVLNEGHCVEQGTHSELVAQNGLYNSLLRDLS